MGVRPPNDDGDTIESVEFGIAAVDARLDAVDLEFPADAEAVRQALGDEPVPYDAKGNTVTIGRALEAAGEDTFETSHDLLNALHPVFERYRTEGAGGVLGRIRAFLPY